MDGISSTCGDVTKFHGMSPTCVTALPQEEQRGNDPKREARDHTQSRSVDKDGLGAIRNSEICTLPGWGVKCFEALSNRPKLSTMTNKALFVFCVMM